MAYQDMAEAMEQERRRRRRKKIIRTAMAWLLAIFIFAAVLVSAAAILMSVGGKNLRGGAQSAGPNLSMEDMTDGEEVSGSGQNSEDPGDGDGTGEETSQADDAQDGTAEDTAEDTPAGHVWQEGWVRYNGTIYEYNPNITTILVMGIDKMTEVQDSKNATDGGQNDANFLVVINPDEKDIKILAVNRDTMTQIRMYGMGEGENDPFAYAQLATQHGFGDGREISCELTRDAVSGLFYDLPIHGYVAINMGAISKLNDAIGGVEVTVLEDLTNVAPDLKEGATVTLKGDSAFWYAKYRDVKKDFSNVTRLARQKQYLGAFAAQVKKAVKQDITLPVNLYKELGKYMVTDITVDEVAYLASTLLDYSVDTERIYTLEGTTQMGEVHEEFYPDKKAMKELMLEVFYREVE